PPPPPHPAFFFLLWETQILTEVWCDGFFLYETGFKQVGVIFGGFFGAGKAETAYDCGVELKIAGWG
ncbi:hypothetical protein, partial [Enterobacter hormaechei]